MPLMQGKSKKAFESNLKTEISEGKPMSQSLAISYAIKRKNKKMAKGGVVKGEPLPMPDQVANDSMQVSQNSGKKPIKQAEWTDSPTVEQAMRPSKTPLSKPKLVGSDAFSVRYRDEVEQEFQEPKGYKAEPPESMDEIDAKKSGPQVPDMQKQHNNKMAAYAHGGEVSPEDEIEDEHYSSITAAIMAKKARQAMMSDSEDDKAVMMAEGGMVDIDENAEEQPNMYYKRNQAALKENYDESIDHTMQPHDSNLIGDEDEAMEENDLDKIGRIRAMMAKKQFKN